MPLYHRDLGYPKSVQKVMSLMECYGGLVCKLQYSEYALGRARNHPAFRDSGGIVLPPAIKVYPQHIFEVGVGDDGKIEKWVVRLPYNHEWDIILAIVSETNVVKTVYLNKVGDEHKTLDPTQYDIP